MAVTVNEKTLVKCAIEPDLLRRIDDYRFEHRFDSRAATIKFLLTWAVEQAPVPPEKS